MCAPDRLAERFTFRILRVARLDGVGVSAGIMLLMLYAIFAVSAQAAPNSADKKAAVNTSEVKTEATPEVSHRESVLRMIEIETARINEAKPVEKTKEEKEREAAEAAKKATRELAKMAAKAKNQPPPPPEKKSPNITVEAIYGSAGEYKAKLNIDGQIVSVGRGWRGSGYDLFEIKPGGVTLTGVCPKGTTACVPDVKFSPFPPPETKTALAPPSATIIKPQAVPGQVTDLPPVPLPITNPQPSRR